MNIMDRLQEIYDNSMPDEDCKADCECDECHLKFLEDEEE